MSTLQSLTDKSLSLIDDLQAHPVGFPSLDSSNGADFLPLSTREQEVLESWDKLEQLRLETSLLRALATVPRDALDPASKHLPGQIEDAQVKLLKAKAAYSLRSNVVENVLITDPTLKAVHSGASATVAERKLRPRIARRDLLSIIHTNLSSSLEVTLTTQSTVETEHVMATKKNAELTQALLKIVAESKTRPEDIKDPKLQSQLTILEKENKAGRSRQRMMKSIVSAVIAGSGVDWARDDTLRELVMDDEEET